MTKKHCLNCNESVAKNFCPNCGQKTDTQRITLKKFLAHDIVHGVWHFERGILFTLKEALSRPGKAALDYISGKRVRYYNVFYLTLLLIGLNLFINHIQNQLSHHYFNTSLEPEGDQAGKSIDLFLKNNAKIIIFSFIPLFAINSRLLYRRKKLNFSEHFIISGMMFLGVMVITTISALFYFMDYLNYVDFLPSIINFATPVAILVYLAVNYYRAFAENYTVLQNSLRVCLFMALLLLEILLLILLMVGYFTNWKYELHLTY